MNEHMCNKNNDLISQLPNEDFIYDLADFFKVFADCRYSHIKKLRYSLLRCPNGLIFIHHMNSILFAFKHEDEKFCRTISYFYILCHILIIIFTFEPTAITYQSDTQLKYQVLLLINTI